MNYSHTRESIPVREWSNPDQVYKRVVKHTFGFKAFGRYLVITWCWC